MFRLTGSSNSRKTDIGSLVEVFIDSNINSFSVDQLELLESLAEEVDEAALEIENELEDLKNDK